MRVSTSLLIDLIRSHAEQGKTRQQTADIIGLRYQTIVKHSLEHGISFKRQMLADTSSKRDRAADMRFRYESGETLHDIGIRYGVTRERVRQIMTKRFGTTAKDGGKAECGRRSRREFQKKRDARSQKLWGCSYREYRRILKIEGKPTYAYKQQRSNSRIREIGWDLTLWQWWKLWDQSGRWAERGRGKGYCMCRLNDSGPYAVDNVYIATGTDNMKDHWVNKRAAANLEAVQ